MVAVRKELEDALARADGLSARLQAAEAERAKGKEAAKAPAQALAVLLGQLQEAPAQRYGMSPSFLCLFFYACSFVVCFDLSCAHAPCTIRVELEKDLVATRMSSARAGGASEELSGMMS